MMDANWQERGKQYLKLSSRLKSPGLLRLGKSEAQRLPVWAGWRLSTEGTLRRAHGYIWEELGVEGHRGSVGAGP